MTQEEAAKGAAENTLIEMMANGSIPELEPLALLTLSMRLRNFSLFKEKALKGKNSLVPAQRVFDLESIPLKVGRKAPKKTCFILLSLHPINGAGDVNLVTINNSIAPTDTRCRTRATRGTGLRSSTSRAALSCLGLTTRQSSCGSRRTGTRPRRVRS